MILGNKFHFRQFNLPKVIYTAIVEGDLVYVCWEDTPQTTSGYKIYTIWLVEDFLASGVWECVD